MYRGDNPFNAGFVSNLKSLMSLGKVPANYDFGREQFLLRAPRSPMEQNLFQKLRVMMEEGADGPPVDLPMPPEQSATERDALTLSEGMASVLLQLRSSLAEEGKSPVEIDSAVAAAKANFQNQISAVLALPAAERSRILAEAGSAALSSGNSNAATPSPLTASIASTSAMNSRNDTVASQSLDEMSSTSSGGSYRGVRAGGSISTFRSESSPLSSKGKSD